jgi:hypothetical protein
MRTVEVKRNGEWALIHMNELRKDEYFKMFEPDGELVVDEEGKSIFYTISEPYYSDKYNTWIVDIGRPLH